MAAAALLMASAASALVPDPEASTVPDVIPVAPNGGLTYQVTIIGSGGGGPINASQVEVRFAVVGDTLICWCNTEPGPSPRKRFASTNASGIANFNLRAGGCVELEADVPGIDLPGAVGYAAEVFADGVKMAECGVVSPDVVDLNGKKATDTPSNWDPNGTCGVAVGDAVFHTTPLAGGPPAYDYCTDMDGDGVAGAIDAIILTPFLAGAVSCAGDAGM
jgi:hypothetical protein